MKKHQKNNALRRCVKGRCVITPYRGNLLHTAESSFQGIRVNTQTHTEALSQKVGSEKLCHSVLHYHAMKRDKPKDKFITFRVTDQEKKIILKFCEKKNASVAEILLSAVRGNYGS